MCFDRQYLAIDNLSLELSIDLILTLVRRIIPRKQSIRFFFVVCFSCVKSENLPADLRAAFCRLMVHMHVNRDPQEEVTRIKYARLWNQVKPAISLNEYDWKLKLKFELIDFVFSYDQTISGSLEPTEKNENRPKFE